MRPKVGRNIGVYKEGTDHVVYGADFSFGFAVLGRGVRAGESKKGTIFCKVSNEGEIVKFMTIVTLELFNGFLELGLN